MLREIVNQLFAPMIYLRINHSAKTHFDITIPLTLTALSSIIFFYIDALSKMEQFDSILKNTLAFIYILPGFYVTALSAIAALGQGNLDDPMPAPAPTLTESMYYDDQISTSKLSRRRFLGLLFAYLSALSFLLAILGSLALTANTHLSTSTAGSIFRSSTLPVFYFFTWQLMTVTFLGLYYLGYKLLKPEFKRD